MSNTSETNGEHLPASEEKAERDRQRIETNKTDPQITELKGFFDPKEPLEEEGTINPLTGNARGPEKD